MHPQHSRWMSSMPHVGAASCFVCIRYVHLRGTCCARHTPRSWSRFSSLPAAEMPLSAGSCGMSPYHQALSDSRARLCSSRGCKPGEPGHSSPSEPRVASTVLAQSVIMLRPRVRLGRLHDSIHSHFDGGEPWAYCRFVSKLLEDRMPPPPGDGSTICKRRTGHELAEYND